MLEDREHPPVAQSVAEETAATTTTTTVPSSVPEVIEELSDFTPLAALPLETAPEAGYTIFSIETPEDSTTLKVIASDTKPIVTTVTGNVITLTVTEAQQPNNTGKTSGETPAGGVIDDDSASAESGDEVLVENEPTVGNGDTGGIYDDDTAEDADAVEEETAGEESAASEEDSAEEAPSPIRGNYTSIYIGNFQNLTGYEGNLYHTEGGAANATLVLSSTTSTDLAKAVYTVLGSEFTASDASISLSNENLEWRFGLVSATDSYTISLFENALFISYTASDGNGGTILNTLTSEEHDALFKAFYIEAYSESAYELYMARETGK
jgi:hypothetical protein